MVAVLIGLVNTGIEQRLELLRRGRSRVIASDHTIILGFNVEKVLAILVELNTAARERGNRGDWSRKINVVILSTVEKQVVQEHLLRPDLNLVDVIVRCGNPFSVAQLFNAGAERASCVIVLNDEDSDIGIVKTLLALRKIPNETFHGKHRFGGREKRTNRRMRCNQFSLISRCRAFQGGNEINLAVNLSRRWPTCSHCDERNLMSCVSSNVQK